MLINGIDFLEIIFQLTLFFLLVSIIYKLIKENLLPFLYKEIENQKKKKKELREEKKLLLISEEKLKSQIKDQKESFVSIEVKVKDWYKKHIALLKKQEEKNKVYIEKINKKRKLQEDNLTLLKTQKVVIPKAIKKAYKKIEDLYGGEKSFGLLKELIEKIEP